MAKYPAKHATSWIGNSVAVANKHYAMKLRDSFSRAIAEGATPQLTPQSSSDKGRKPATQDFGRLKIAVKDAIFPVQSSLVAKENDPYGTRITDSNARFLAFVDTDTADNTALVFPTLEQLAIALKESLNPEEITKLVDQISGLND